MTKIKKGQVRRWISPYGDRIFTITFKRGVTVKYTYIEGLESGTVFGASLGEILEGSEHLPLYNSPLYLAMNEQENGEEE